MIFRNLLSFENGTVKVIAFTITLTVFIFLGSAIYYGQLNSLEDSRLSETQSFHKDYNLAVENREIGTALSILDKWEDLYKKTSGYADSYEIGVLYNNRASLYLVEFETEVLLNSSEDFTPPFHYLDKAETHITKAIQWYERWLEKYANMPHQDLVTTVEKDFPQNDPSLQKQNIEKVRAKRVESLLLAQIETSRRLSVSLTNYGVILRYRNKPEEAEKAYNRAISLWDKNYTAQDNLDVLQGKKPQKRPIIDKLFPPEKDK